MPEMLKFSLNNTDIEVVASFTKKWSVILDAVAEKMTYLMTRLEEKARAKSPHAYADPLTLEAPGKLQASIQAQPAEIRGYKVFGSVIQDMDIAPYGPVLEKGGLGEYVIRPIGKPTPGGPGLGGSRAHTKGATRRFGKDVLRYYSRRLGRIEYATYLFHPPLLARPYMAPALEEMKDEVRESLRLTIAAAVKR